MEIKSNTLKVFNILDSFNSVYQELHDLIISKIHSIQSNDFDNLLQLEKKENTLLIRINILSKSLSATLYSISQKTKSNIEKTEDLIPHINKEEQKTLMEKRNCLLFISKKTILLNKMVGDILFELNNIERRLMINLNNSLGDEKTTYHNYENLKTVSGLNVIG